METPKIKTLQQEIREYGLNSLYILLTYGHLIFFCMGGTLEQYNALMEEYEYCMQYAVIQ